MEKITLNEILALDKLILKNKIICFPTDTVYGVGCLANDLVAMEKIYEMKHREQRKPLPILCSSINQALELVDNVSDEVYRIMNKYWPGALTIILKKKTNVLVNTYKDTIALRIPNSNISLQLINHFSSLATTSVNISGEKEINSISEIEDEFYDFIDYLITDKETFNNVPSTIIDCTTDKIKVVREGIIKVE